MIYGDVYIGFADIYHITHSTIYNVVYSNYGSVIYIEWYIQSCLSIVGLNIY